jgi:hypothetical protein
MIHHLPAQFFGPRDTHQISQDPKLQEAVSKLVAAGIIRTG